MVSEGPMQGQANHFYRLAKERIPYPTQRYVGETERLYGVLDHQLEGRDYLVGPGKGKYSIADIANFGWVNVAYFAGVDLSKFPNLESWWQRIYNRPAVKKSMNVAYQRRLKEEPGFKENEDRLKDLGDKAKEQYNYKYASP
jgi:glutathione S-transferase